MSDPGKYPPNTDPAYGQYPQYSGQYTAPTYYGQTEQMPTYWQPGMGYPPNQAPPPPPEPPKSPRWLWIAAAAAVLLVAGLVLTLVIVSSSTKESTVVAPQTSRSSSSSRASSPVPTSTRVPSATRAPGTTASVPPLPTTAEPGTPTTPGETTTSPTSTETVVYSVTGEGRAINITYVDTGGVMQTEFNVALPWSKEVTLSAPAKSSASVAVVNVGRDVTCSVTVNGAQVRQRTGQGLTICTGAV